jgi:uncharacterized protein involved in exopolysaccharide biosynthesis
MSDDYDSDDGEGGGGLNTELIFSYLAFVKRAIVRRKYLVLGVFAAVMVLALLCVRYWPRTYYCESRLMATGKGLSQRTEERGGDALKGATEFVVRHENLEAIIKQTDLVRLYQERRQPIIKLKDAILEKFRGPIGEKALYGGLVWTLEEKLKATTEGSSLTISVEWPDAQSSALIVDAAQNNFFEVRHVAEISTISEYISILEGHASRLRGEVDALAQQIRQLKENKRNESLARLKGALGPKATPAEVNAAATRGIVVPARPRSSLVPDEETVRLKVMLEAKQRAIADLEDSRQRRLVDLQSKLADMQTKYTAQHPLVIDAKQGIASLSQETSQVSALRGEVRSIEADIRRRTGSAESPSGGTVVIRAPGEAAAPTAAPLPADITNLLQDIKEEDLDPAVTAQFRYAVENYSSIRGQISSARVDLDTSQAAFKYRYKVVVPPEAPDKAIKPKIPLILGGGFFLALVLSLISAIAAELKDGRIVESWQVQQIALPLLAELSFPPAPSSSSTDTTPD